MPYTATSPSLPFSEPTTSRDAALAMVPKAQIQRDRVLAFITAAGVWGATMADVELGLGIKRASCCPRFDELVKAGQIVRTEHRRSRCAVYCRPYWVLVK